MWYLNGKRHHEDGPAMVWNGTKQWYIKGKLHREDGPAIEGSDGTQWWYLNDELYTFEEFLEKTPLSREEKIELKLTYMTEFA